MTKSDSYPPPGAYRFKVEEKFSELRLDQYLAEASEQFSRGMAKRLIDIGGVYLCGRRVRRCSQTVAHGEMVEVYVDQQPLSTPTLEEQHILYRDNELIVINKPAGMATQPTPSRYQGTLYAELQKLLINPRRRLDKPSIGMVQRLDRDTSGVMVFSIHKRAHKKMTEAFRGRDIGKLYWAMVEGKPEQDEGAFCSLLAKRRSTNLMVSVERGGKRAETHYRLLDAMEQASLVEVRLITGRSHQIRAHFSEAGMPLLGDTAYGGRREIDGIEVPRQMLHSRELSFRHPVTQKNMLFTAPAPEDFVSIQTHLSAP